VQKVTAIATAFSGIARCEWCELCKSTLILCRCTSFEVCTWSRTLQLLSCRWLRQVMLRLPTNSTVVGDADGHESQVIHEQPRATGQILYCWWHDSVDGIDSGIVPVMVNPLNWMITYRIWLMEWLIAFEFSSECVEMDFDWLVHRHVSSLVGLWNQLRIISATVNINLVYIPSLFASAICHCQFWTISSSLVSWHVSGRLASGICTKSSPLLLTSIQ